MSRGEVVDMELRRVGTYSIVLSTHAYPITMLESYRNMEMAILTKHPRPVHMQSNPRLFGVSGGSLLVKGCRCKFLTFDFILPNIDSRRWLD